MNQPEVTVHVSADQAAAWLTGQPYYDMMWPECAGKCLNGYCALPWDHPACCFVRRKDDTPRDPDHMAAISRSGYWKSRDFFCWR